MYRMKKETKKKLTNREFTFQLALFFGFLMVLGILFGSAVAGYYDVQKQPVIFKVDCNMDVVWHQQNDCYMKNMSMCPLPTNLHCSMEGQAPLYSQHYFIKGIGEAVMNRFMERNW